MTIKDPVAFLKSIPPEQLASVKKQLDKHLAERSLYHFVKQAWKWIDPSPFVESWAIQGLCLHLEAVTRGDIRFLLVNFPPRCSKTLVTSVIWPLWTWIQKDISHTSGPQVGIAGASYGQDLSLKASDKMRNLIGSPWFQETWGDKIQIKAGSDTKSDFTNTKGGYRQATSITGRLLGYGGAIWIVDDPHNTEDVESEAERENVLRGWREISGTRMNDPKRSAIVVIMQRLNEEDVSGDILSSRTKREWVHYCVPMRHDTGRHCVTYLPGYDDEPFWEDPREEDGDLMWPERFGDEEVDAMEIDLGPYMASGRLQQSPSPAGGGIIKREWWQLWDGPRDANGREQFPELELVVASLDPAYTEKQENDYSALTIWGLWRKNGVPKLILLNAWQKRLTLHGPAFDPQDILGWALMDSGERASIQRKNWGLVEWVNHSCTRFKCDKLLIEAKASGLSVAQEMRRLYRDAQFSVETVNPKMQDKVARMHAVVPLFADGTIYAPDRDWAETVIAQVEVFPKGMHDDLCFAAGTLIATKRGHIPIETVKIGDECLTPSGWNKVLCAGQSGLSATVTRFGLTATPNHPVFTLDRSYQRIDTLGQDVKLGKLSLCGLIQIIRQRKLFSMASSTAAWEEKGSITSHKALQMLDGKKPKGSMLLSGKMRINAAYLMGTRFITLMVIPSITALRIWSAYRSVTIAVSLSGTWKNRARIWSGLDRWLLSGTDLTKGENGTRNMFTKVCTRIVQNIKRFAISVANNLNQSSGTPDFVVITAASNFTIALNVTQLAQRQERVLSVEQNLPRKYLAEKCIAVLSAVRERDKKEKEVARQHHDLEPVYNLTVEGEHCYFANGILVHNCDSLSQCLKYMRDTGLIIRRDEFTVDEEDLKKYRSPSKPLYPV